MLRRVLQQLLPLAMVLSLFASTLVYAQVTTGYTRVSVEVTPNGPTSADYVGWPEKRVNAATNRSTKTRLLFYDVGDTSTLLQSNSFTTTNTGSYSSIDLTAFDYDNYDIYVKGESHLTKKLPSYVLYDGMPAIDATENETAYLLAGDVNGVEFGDDIVNAIDLSIVLNDLDAFDLRSDLNRDNIVNSLDLSVLLTNLDVLGETS